MRRAPSFLLLAFALALPLARADDAADAERRRQAIAANEEGVKLLEAGDAEGSLARFRDALALLPDETVIRGNTAKAHATIARKLYDDKRWRDAAKAFREAAALDDKELEFQHGEGLALAQAGDDRAAWTVLERVAAADGTRRTTLVALGEVLYRLGKLEQAIARWKRALELDGKDDALKRSLEKAQRESQVEAALDEDLGAPHFAIRVDGAKDAGLARFIGGLLEDAYRDVGYDLGRYPQGEVPVVIYPTKTFRKATGMHGWIAAAFDGKIRIPAEGISADKPAARAVLVHEFTHAVIRSVGGPDVPAWLHEGLAQLEENASRTDARAVLAKSPPPTFKDLSATFTKERDEKKVTVLYAAALEFTASLADRVTRRGLVDVLDRVGKGETLDAASKTVLGATPAELYATWSASPGR